MWLRKWVAVALILACAACASAARLAWDANQDDGLTVGYKIYYGLASRQYTNTVDVGNVTEWPIPAEWPRNQDYYFAATAYDLDTNESGYSNEAIYYKEITGAPLPATDVLVTFQQITEPPMANRTVNIFSGDWQASTTYTSADVANNTYCANDTSPVKIYKLITAGTTAGSGGPTGTSTDITDGTAHWAYQGERHYASLNAALTTEAATYADLVTNTMILTFDCYNFEDTTLADTGTGYTTSASYYINIVAHDSHGGVEGTSSYRIKLSKTYGGVITNQEEYTRIIGLQIENTGSKADQSKGILSSATFFVERCLIKTSGTGTAEDNTSGIWSNSANTDSYLSNNIIYGGWYRGIRVGSYTSSKGYIYNNTIPDSTNIDFVCIGMGTLKLRNNIGVGNQGYALVDCTTTSATNISSDTSSPDSAFRSKTITFVGAADFHLASTETDAINAGTDLTSDADYPISVDIDGTTRPTGAGTWDIGADEYVSAGGASIVPILLHQYRARRD